MPGIPTEEKSSKKWKIIWDDPSNVLDRYSSWAKDPAYNWTHKDSDFPWSH